VVNEKKNPNTPLKQTQGAGGGRGGVGGPNKGWGVTKRNTIRNQQSCAQKKGGAGRGGRKILSKPITQTYVEPAV